MLANNRSDLIGRDISDTEFLFLKEIIIADNVENIYDGAFCYHNLSSIVIPNSVKHIGDYAFQSCDNLKSIVIPDSVESIGAHAFAHCKNLTTVYLNNGLKSIGDSAFLYCEKLSSINIPNSVNTIGKSAFFECQNLININIPKGMSVIEQQAFERCGLISVLIPEGIVSIGNRAFECCKKLKSIKIPGSVHSISESAFNHCSGLEKIEISRENEIYDSREDCNAIIKTKENTMIYYCKDTIIPDGVKKIDYLACSKGVGMKSIRIPQSLNSITVNTFGNCCDIESIIVDEHHKKFDSRNNCNAIINKNTKTLVLGCNSTVIPLDVEVIGKSAFRFCDLKSSITLSRNIKKIEKFAFTNCKGLNSIVIPGCVEIIEEKAFNNCEDLKSVTFCDGITSIGRFVFMNCRNIEKIYFPNSIESIGDFMVPINRKVKIIVPKGSKEKFKSLLQYYKKCIVEE